MPVHSVATVLQHVEGNYLIFGVLAIGALGLIRVRSGGRKTTWERDWAGKMILIVVRSYTNITYSDMIGAERFV